MRRLDEDGFEGRRSPTLVPPERKRVFDTCANGATNTAMSTDFRRAEAVSSCDGVADNTIRTIREACTGCGCDQCPCPDCNKK